MRDGSSWEAQDVPRSTPRLQSNTRYSTKLEIFSRNLIVNWRSNPLKALDISRIWAIIGSLGSVLVAERDERCLANWKFLNNGLERKRITKTKRFITKEIVS